MADDVIVIGGGLAGLAAAVELTARGLSVSVLEKAGIAGGKLSGFRDADGDSVEHGFHGWWTQYFNCFDVFGRVGVPDDTLVGPVDTAYFLKDGSHFTLDHGGANLPSPLFLLRSLGGMKGIGLLDKLSAVGLLDAFGFSHARDYDRFDDRSVRSHLRRTGGTRNLHDVAIEALSRSFGFTDSGELSAGAFLSVLSFALVGHQDDVAMRVCRGNPGELLIAPMVTYIESHGGTVRTSASVGRLELVDGRIEAAVLTDPAAEREERFPLSDVPLDRPIRRTFADGTACLVRRVAGGVAAHSAICTHQSGPTDHRMADNDYYCPWHGGRFDLDGQVLEGPPTQPLPTFDAAIDGADVVVRVPGGAAERLEADWFILASEVPGTKKIISDSPGLGQRDDIRRILNLRSTDSMVLRLWLDRAPPPSVVTGVFTRPGLIDNLFVLSRLHDEFSGYPGSVLEVHMYVVRDRMHDSDEVVISTALAELEERFPSLQGATVRKSHIARHPGTFTLFSPGSNPHRPRTRSSVANLLFAGDWIQTDQPWWCMERAVATGRLAADVILEHESLERPTMRAPREDALFVRAAKTLTGVRQDVRDRVASLLGFAHL